MNKRFRPDPKTLQPLNSGPLGAHLESFAALLVEHGYASASGWNKMRLVTALSRWMVQEKLRVEDLDEQQISPFLGWRWNRVVHRSGDQCHGGRASVRTTSPSGSGASGEVAAML